jgi:hypothetical protein
VDEAQQAEVNDHAVEPARIELVKQALQLERRRQIELAPQHDAGAPARRPHLHVEEPGSHPVRR